MRKERTVVARGAVSPSLCQGVESTGFMTQEGPLGTLDGPMLAFDKSAKLKVRKLPSSNV